MNSHHHRHCLLIVALVCSLGSTALAQGFDLRPIWTQGQTATYQSTTRRVSTMQIKGPGIPADAPTRSTVMVIDGRTTWEVVDPHPDGGGVCRMSMQDVSVELTNAGGQTYNVDRSQSPEALLPLQRFIRALMDHPVTVTVQPDGAVGKVEGWKAVQNAGGEAAEDLEPEDFQEAAWELAPLVSGAAEATIGQSWSDRNQWSHDMGRVKLKTRYSLAGYEQIDGVELLSLTTDSDIDFDVDREQLPEEGPDVDLKFKGGRQSGRVFFDPARHEVFARHIEQVLQFQMTLKLPDRRIEQHITQNQVTQVIRLDEK